MATPLAAVTPWGMGPVDSTTNPPAAAPAAPAGSSALPDVLPSDFFSSPIFGLLFILGLVVYFDGRLLPRN